MRKRNSELEGVGPEEFSLGDLVRLIHHQPLEPTFNRVDNLLEFGDREVTVTSVQLQILDLGPRREGGHDHINIIMEMIHKG